TKVFPYDTVELSQANGPNFKVNGHHVKYYFGGDVPQLVVPDLQTFPSDPTVNVTSKTSHLHFVKRIFRYLKGQPKLGVWYPSELAFDLEAYSDSDYAEQILTRNPQQERQNMLLLPTAVGDFNKLDDLVDEGADYAVNEGRSTYKIKVLNAKAKEVSTIGETLNAATLAVSTASVQTVLGSRMKKMSKRQKTNADLEEEEQLRAFLNIIPDK
nr:uncharacterized mitochondrial protein AtMg00810-like [Tanacetum cinerariifolium]